MTENTSEILLQAMHKLGLSKGRQIAAMAPLTGGVSSDIWRIDFETHSICAKRALAQLKVSALWQAPLSRNAFEYDWYQVVAPHFPQHVPQMLGRDEEHGVFFMSYLEPSQHPVWKDRLLQGQIDPDFAASVGDALGRIHQLSANSAELAQRFKSDPEFYSLRLEPYLLATAQKHPELAAVLQALCETCAHTRLALVHGDVSPKNILCAPGRPIFLDAECAWYGDPAFDLAFCLNHLLLKMIHRPDRQQALALSFTRLTQAYLGRVQWESLASFEQRTAQLLPALLLARVDGKSPVEYLREAHQHQTVRHIARAGLLKPTGELERVLELTMKALNA
jgi:aminoglycoside phosphotransferase (APT) family kinase protein